MRLTYFLQIGDIFLKSDVTIEMNTIIQNIFFHCFAVDNVCVVHFLFVKGADTITL